MKALPPRIVVLSLALALSAGSLAAQDAPNREAATLIRKEFLTDLDTLQSKFLALAAAFPADKFSWRPGEGVRSVGEVFMHVASEYYVYTPMAFGAPRSPLLPRGPDTFKNFEAKSTKDDVLRELKAGFAYMRETVPSKDIATLTGTQNLFGGSHTIAETTIGMTADLHEHLGQLIAYARMNGVVPPWSK